MTSEPQSERALNEADRMRIEASHAEQLGFKELARFLRKNADDAMKWASDVGKREAKS